MRVAPDQSFGGPVIRVDGEFDVRMISSGGVYHVLVQPRSQYAGGAVNILVGGLDNVQVEINRLPPPGVQPAAVAPRAHAQRPLDTRPLVPRQAFVLPPEQPAEPVAPAVVPPTPKSAAPVAPAVTPTPVKPAPAAPSRAFTPDPDAPGPVVPPSNAHAQARQRLRQDIDKSSPW